jgi:hypothetical protein
MADEEQEINAEPTKSFFVDMLVRDIALEQAILDLVDNCVDGAKRLSEGSDDFTDKKIEIALSSDAFVIWDNCGGFSRSIARDYAFRFGRAPGARSTPHSIGQFGVGMKRALFKFGKWFRVDSATADEQWAVEVDVPVWEIEDGWTFPWANADSAEVSTKKPGTNILVKKLRPEVASRLGSKNFENTIVGLIKSKHRQFISQGLDVRVNENRVDATNLSLLFSEQLKPGVDVFELKYSDAEPVNVKVIAGVGPSIPREAGWYVICNGRVVLEADRRNVTGWGLMEEQQSRLIIPAYHNQFARFRGVVWFDSDDSSQVPWNTTKDDVDQDSPAWQATFEKMQQMMRPVIDFLNELDRDIDEYTRDKSPLLDFVSKTPLRKSDTLSEKTTFAAPARDSVQKGPRYVKVQYSRPVDDVEILQKELGVRSAKAVGEKTFDLTLARFSDE